MARSKKGKFTYFRTGFVVGALLAIGLSAMVFAAFKHYRSGEGLGQAKAMARRVLKGMGAEEWQMKRFKKGGLPEKWEVVKELLVVHRDNLPWRKNERRFPLWMDEGSAEYRIAVATSLDRVFPDGMALAPPVVGATIDLAAAGNEYEGFQILVAAGDALLSDVSLDISEFMDSRGRVAISGRFVEWRVVGYVTTKRPYYPVKFVGDWPDPLLLERTVDIQPDSTQPFWVTVYVPAGTPAGTYEAQVGVYSGKKLLDKVPVVLKVFDFALPRETKLKTAFDFYPDTTHYRYPPLENEDERRYRVRIAELNERYIIDMLRHRLNPILNADVIDEATLGRLEWYRRLGLNNFAIGRRGGTFGNNWPAEDKEIEAFRGLYERYGTRLAIEGLLPNHYIYMWDESSMGDPRVAKIAAMIHRGDPRLKNMVCYHGFWDPQKHPGWGDDIDIWCFQIDSFDQEKMDELKRRGMEIWMYVSSPGGKTSPNFVIDTDSMDYRIVPWLCWKYDIKGLLYWCVNWWPFVDPFEDTNNTQWGQNGNGLLYYPGPEGPISSIRLEVLRDGLEDYEYLYLLKVIVRTVKAMGLEAQAGDLLKEAEELLEVDVSIARSMTDFTKDTRVFLERRRKIGEAIEELGAIIKKSGL